MSRLQRIKDKVDRHLGEPDSENRWEDMLYLLDKLDELEEQYSDYGNILSENEFLKDDIRELEKIVDVIEEKSDELISILRRKGF